MQARALARWLGENTQTSLRVAVLILSAVGILALATAIEMFKVGERTARYQAALDRSVEQRSQIRRIATAVLDAESSQRGYLLTGRREHLERFAAERSVLLESIESLDSRYGASDPQRRRVARLAEFVESRLDQLTRGLAIAAPDGVAEPLIEESAANLGLRTMGEIRGLVDEILAAKEEQIRRASLLAEEQTRWSRTVTIALLCSIVILVTAVLALGLTYLGHQARLASQLRNAARVAEQASDAKTEFLASMSHEIRTPLTGILGYTELLLDETLSTRQRELVERLQTAGVGLSTIVNDILDFSRIEAGQVELEIAPFSLGALIDNVMSIVSVTARRKSLRLDCKIEPGLPATVAGDEPRLRQILLNLLHNAVKFTSEGSVTLRACRPPVDSAEDIIRFEVIDTGIGIAPEMQNRLFRRFSQLESSIQREYGGTGLGLAISRKLVELMDGKIGVDSEGGRGSTFWFSVPLPEATVADDQADDTYESSRPLHGRILLVEDSPQNTDLVCTILERDGHHIDIAPDGEEAVAAVGAATYDLILMDMQMPRMDGVTATRLIRELDSPMRQVPIIGMTANVLPEQMRSFVQAGIDDCLPKPFKKAQLTAKVNHWLIARAAQSVAAAGDASPPEDHDADAFAEMRDLMGDAWVRASLTRLKERVEGALTCPSTDTRDRRRLGREAHQIIADAGQLGFRDLSRACRNLEEACADPDRDLAPAREQARMAGRTALATADRLLATIGT